MLEYINKGYVLSYKKQVQKAQERERMKNFNLISELKEDMNFLEEEIKRIKRDLLYDINGNIDMYYSGKINAYMEQLLTYREIISTFEDRY